MDGNGDYVLTNHRTDYHYNTPAAVAQAIRTRLLLYQGEWFLDQSQGTAWKDRILGKNTLNTYSTILKDQILGTPGVTNIVAFNGQVDAAERSLTVSATVDTLYGGQVSLTVPIGPSGNAPATLADKGPAVTPAPTFTMRYRKLDANGDYVLTNNKADYLRNSPAAVAQAVKTRLALWTGEFFLNTAEGTPWLQGILGKANAQYDILLRDRILGTPGVSEIISYSSSVSGRNLSISATINTVFGRATLQTVL
jgi:hypothetical protein